MSAAFSDTFIALHEQMEKAGQLDHPFEAHGHRSLLPVRRWVDGAYRDVPALALIDVD